MTEFRPERTVVRRALCAAYVLVKSDMSDLVRYPLQPGELFRAELTDPDGVYKSMSGFRAFTEDEMSAYVGQFKTFLMRNFGEATSSLAVKGIVDPTGIHPIP